MYSKRCVDKIEAHKCNKAEPFLGGFKMLIEVLEKSYQPLLGDCLCVTTSLPLHAADVPKLSLKHIRECLEIESKVSDVFFVYMRWASIWTYELGKAFSKKTPCFSRNEFITENLRLFRIAALFHQIDHHKMLMCEHVNNAFCRSSMKDINEIEVQVMVDSIFYLNDYLKEERSSFRLSSREEIEESVFVFGESREGVQTVSIQQFYKFLKSKLFV